ncbi:MAG: DEAD/DEAH box helicase [Planctomycetaceae bacterium]|nr:MAG: DEAD/DEAH box helicase [Planctomycetaceae bacterium]
MEMPIESEIAVLSVAMKEAVECLVNEHPASLDKRAAMQEVTSPTLMQRDGTLEFGFAIRADKSIVASPKIRMMPEMVGRPRKHSDLSLIAIADCDCEWFSAREQCPHTLAASWWLQEQLTRRSPSQIDDFMASLKVDAVALGRTLVDQLVKIADRTATTKALAADCRVQWRVRVSPANHFASLSITPYEQRVRKGGAGWTKGRELRLFDLEDREDLFSNPVDARVASLVARSVSNFGPQGYNLYEALLCLAGHSNVAWNDSDATPLQILRGELTLSIRRERDAVGSGSPADAPSEVAAPSEPADGTDMTDRLDEVANPDLEDELIDGGVVPSRARFLPRLRIAGIDQDIDARSCEIIAGKVAANRPLMMVVPPIRDRLILCELKDQRSARLVEHLLDQDLDEVTLDAEAATRLAMAAAKLDPLVRIDLPPELSGPVESGEWELIVELRPRPTAGLHVALRVLESRCPETLVPGEGVDRIRCHSEQGPIRLCRDLDHERVLAKQTAARFGIDSLAVDGPYGWAATTDDAALNLLGALSEAGDEAPAILWPEGQTMRVRGELTPQSLRVKLDDRRDWFGMTGAIEIDGQEISLADLLVAVRENRNLVRVGDREFASISAGFRRRLQQLDDSVVVERGALRIADAAAPIVSELLGEDVTLETAARWQETIQRLSQIRDWAPDPPEGLKAGLRDYQVDGYRWLARLSRWGVGGVLADDMGLGKTVQTLGVLLDRAAEGPALVVAPTSVGENWARETARFAPSLAAHSYREHDRQHLIDSANAGDLVIVSYQLLQRDAERFAAREWHTLVLDEAQFIKNAATKTSQAIRSIRADWRIGLSGTPLENHLGELWSLFRTLSPGLLGSWERFRTRFAEPIQRQQNEQRRESLAQLVRPFILRRTKSAVLKELPERTEVTLLAELSPEERQLYEDARLSAIAELSGSGATGAREGEQRFRTLAWLTKLRQLACHPRLVDKGWRKGSAKLRLLMETVGELREGEHRALVFSQFVRHLDLVRAALDERGVSYQYLDGSTPAAERQRRIDAFQNGEGEFFLISLKAGGTGLNLTAANYVLHLDPWWNPAVEDQATDRAHRIGQERAVTVYRLVAKGTIEEQIIELHASKRELVANVLGGTDQAARLDNEELIDLIRSGSGID